MTLLLQQLLDKSLKTTHIEISQINMRFFFSLLSSTAVMPVIQTIVIHSYHANCKNFSFTVIVFGGFISKYYFHASWLLFAISFVISSVIIIQKKSLFFCYIFNNNLNISLKNGKNYLPQAYWLLVSWLLWDLKENLIYKNYFSLTLYVDLYCFICYLFWR